MTEEIITEYGLTEYTEEFLSSVNYPNVSMDWSEWQEEAKNFDLTEEEIAELRNFLEQNNQLTQPVRFAGKQWWFMQKEIDHIEMIKQCYGTEWEEQVFHRMNRKELGRIEQDRHLEKRIPIVISYTFTGARFNEY